LEALSATGLRSIRYALEIPGIHKIIANDINPAAVELIKRNITHNKVDDLVTPNCADARHVLFGPFCILIDCSVCVLQYFYVPASVLR
jgi:tRNA (guanine26-N2/guanine27-N2)-dimethyltransferase